MSRSALRNVAAARDLERRKKTGEEEVERGRAGSREARLRAVAEFLGAERHRRANLSDNVG